MKNDLTSIYEKYKGLWIATLEDWTVVGSGKTLPQARREAESKGYMHACAMFVAEEPFDPIFLPKRFY